LVLREEILRNLWEMMFLLRGGEGGGTVVDASFFIPCVNNITTAGIFIHIFLRH